MNATTVYEVKPSPGKGLGMFVAKPIHRGQMIIREKSIFSLHRPRGQLDVQDIYGGFIRLQQADQECYLQLSACQPMIDLALRAMSPALPQGIREYVAHIISIFETNSFLMECSGGNDTIAGRTALNYGIFPISARINHSCYANASASWNPTIGCLTVHAIKDIPVGEEITISYVSPSVDAAAGMLSRSYGIVCTCPGCDPSTASSPSVSASRQRRQTIWRLTNDLSFLIMRTVPFGERVSGPLSARLVDHSGFENPLRAIQELDDLLSAEGLVGYETVPWYVYAATLHYTAGDIRRSLYWHEKALDVELCVRGKHHPEVSRRRQIIKRLQRKLRRA